MIASLALKIYSPGAKRYSLRLYVFVSLESQIVQMMTHCMSVIGKYTARGIVSAYITRT